MLALCHIFTDIKFVDIELDNFQSDLFINKIIFLGKGNTYEGKYKNIFECFSYCGENIEKIINISANYDVIICYNLDYYKALIINGLPADKKIVWRFFGTEYYNHPKYQLNNYSEKTKQILGINRCYFAKVYAYSFLRFIKYSLQNKNTPTTEFNHAIRRVKYFLSYDKDEYLEIRKHWKVFPEYVELSAFLKVKKISDLVCKKNYIVLGNSKAPENNHIDIIELFEKFYPSEDDYLLLPLSYGTNLKYNNKLIHRIRLSKLHIQVLDNFLPFDLYMENIGKSKSAIINSYRQMALGNIFLFLGNDVKVYLSERNPSYNWLRKFGFIVFSIEKNLKNDIINNNFLLESHQADKNRSILETLSEDNNILNFHKTFHKCLG